MTDNFLTLIYLEQREVIVVMIQGAEVYQTDRVSELVSRLLTQFADPLRPSTQRSLK